MANHHCKLDSSPRLKRVYGLLEDNMWHTSREIASKGRTIAPGSTISELRTNGLNIESRYKGMIDDAKVFEYRIVPKIKEQMNLRIVGLDVWHKS